VKFRKWLSCNNIGGGECRWVYLDGPSNFANTKRENARGVRAAAMTEQIDMPPEGDEDAPDGSAEPKAIPAAEVEQILNRHREWIESKGGEGEKANFHRAFLQDAYFQGGDLRGANFSEASLHLAELQNANLYRADLTQANLQHASLQKSNMREANMEGAHFIQANLQGADLRKANLQRADLRDADLFESRLQGADIEGVYCKGANLFLADLRRANCREINLQDVDLQGGDIFSEGDLSSAPVQDARLAGVEMRGTQVQAADFLDALGLTKKQTEEADADDQTRFPSHLVDGGD